MKVSDKVFKYLKASYQYYIKYEDTGMSDYEYDMLCKWLYDNFDSLSEEDQSVLDKDALKAGTGYQISKDIYRMTGVM
jgi:hypothetical protein